MHELTVVLEHTGVLERINEAFLKIVSVASPPIRWKELQL